MSGNDAGELRATQADRDVLEALDDALGFLMDAEREIVLEALVRHRLSTEARQALSTTPTPASDGVTPEAIAAAIKKTEYKYFGDYEMSDDQREAVDVLVQFAQEYYTPTPDRFGEGYRAGVEAALAKVDAEYNLRKQHHDAHKAAGTKKEARDFETMMIAHSQSRTAIRALQPATGDYS